jgi:hypothetical protein
LTVSACLLSAESVCLAFYLSLSSKKLGASISK